MRRKLAGVMVAAVVSLLLCLGLVSSAGAALSFASPATYGTATGPRFVTTGDFNKDGRLDLASADDSVGKVSILLGNGNGTFQTKVDYGTFGGTWSLTVGDFNSDGNSDLAVADIGSNNVSILLGDGAGAFAWDAVYTVGTNPIFITLGDFNGDGKLDLVTANSGSGNISILLGVGDGTFGAASNFAVGTGPRSIAVGDFDSDGDLDLAVANFGANTVSILLGDGAGSFTAATDSPYTVGTQPLSIIGGDFNRDGKLDLAVANRLTSNVSILIGDGDGTFTAGGNFGAGIEPASLTSGDFDGDGKTDLAVADRNTGNLVVLAGIGDGTFAAAVNFGVGDSSALIFSLTGGDFNGDGKTDLAVVSYFNNNISILLNTTTFDPAGVFAAAKNYGTGSSPLFVAGADFNRDGRTDLAVANYSSEDVSIMLGNVDGTFQAKVDYAVGSFPLAVAVGDFDRDGKPDLATANYYDDNVAILLGNGLGAFAAAANYGAGIGPISVAVGDFNRDGKPDLATANSVNSGTVSILLGDGLGGFAAAVSYGVGSYPNSVAVGDFDRDGDLDLAVTNEGGNVSILLGNGLGAFAAAVPYGAGYVPISVAVGDFDGDGDLDLAVANYGSDNVSILLGNGLGVFALAVNYPLYPVGTSPYSVAVGDFDRDGKPDLAVASWGGYVSILPGVGDGTFQTAVNYGTGIQTSSVAVGDFNRDGKLDLAAANQNGNNVSILLNTSFVFTGPAVSNFQINAGAARTAFSTVNLTYDTSGPPTRIRTSTGIPDPVTGAYWSAWKIIPAPGTHTLNLGAANGTREVYAQVKDASGNISPAARDNIILDTVAPAGRVKINGGATTVKADISGTTTVRLDLALFDRSMGGAQVRKKVGAAFSGDPDALAPWTGSSEWINVNLTGTGTKTIYVQFKDGVGRKSAVYAPSITVSNSGADWLPSTVTMSGVQFTPYSLYATNPTVNFHYFVSDIHVLARYCFIHSDGTLSWTAWEAPVFSGQNVNRTLTLAGGNIPRQVYVQLKETAGGPTAVGAVTALRYAQITLDASAPSGKVLINKGAASVQKTGDITYVDLTLACSDTASGIDRIAVYQGTAPASPDDVDFFTFSPTVVYPLNTTTTGTKNVYVWIKDLAGRISNRKSDSINVLP